ncbi:MAG: transporter [Ignavibacteria bacterium]|nr:transporter [Ignavibacteria bacterium]
MKKIIIITAVFALLFSANAYSQICCGGGVYDIAVLSLNKKSLFNVGLKFDNYTGVWDRSGNWLKTKQTNWQMSPAFSGAYRFNRHLQAGVLVPYLINKNELPGLPSNGSGIGDIVASGRYEIFHEYALYKDSKKLDEKTPYIAVTFGMTFPTGKSDENADNEIDVTGKGFYTTSLGLSMIKTILKNKFQIGTDLSWQHSFEKTYNKYYGSELSSPYKRQLGERFNYAVTANYLINFYNSVSLAFAGYVQGNHKIDGSKIDGSNENSFGFVASYTYYPKTYIRLTPLVKWNIPSDNIGINAQGSLMFSFNFVYYIENLEDL